MQADNTWSEQKKTLELVFLMLSCNDQPSYLCFTKSMKCKLHMIIYWTRQLSANKASPQGTDSWRLQANCILHGRVERAFLKGDLAVHLCVYHRYGPSGSKALVLFFNLLCPSDYIISTDILKSIDSSAISNPPLSPSSKFFNVYSSYFICPRISTWLFFIISIFLLRFLIS